MAGMIIVSVPDTAAGGGEEKVEQFMGQFLLSTLLLIKCC
jgi:hypothetical protein